MKGGCPRLGLLLLLGALSLLPGIGAKDPWPADEPRFVLIASEMLRSGDWLIPVRAGEPYPDKPPLFLWLEAVVLAATGSIRLAHQLPSLISAILVTLLVYDLGRRLWNRRVGLWSAAILLSTIQFVLQGRSGQIDATLTLFTTLGLYGILRHGLLRPSWPWYLGGCAAMGLGVMTKGVGFLPAFALIPLGFAHRRGWRLPGHGLDRRWLWGLLAFALPLALWLVPLLSHVAASGTTELTRYRDDLLLHQTVDRYADSWGHLRPPWYYIVAVIPWAWLPATLALPWLLPAWLRRLRRRDPRYLVLLGWVVLVVLFFSLSPGKRGVYMLPVTPALALATAPLAAGLWRQRRLHRTAFVLTVLLAGLCLAAALSPGRLEDAGLPSLTLPLLVLAASVAAAALIARPRRGLAAFVSAMAVLWTVIGLWIYPRLDPWRSGAAMMVAVEGRLPAGGELAIADWREQMILQAKVPVVHFGYHTPPDEQARQVATWLLRSPSRNRALVPEVLSKPCFAPTAQRVTTAHGKDWLLASRHDVTEPCGIEPRPAVGYRSLPLDHRG